ncbi:MULTISPECIES: NAD(P)/FAD-dependent oxidoreductase [unclassified Rhodococcus (in: high G+C Gram-positive bacteria)]|uniref:NAD(P)/FAD-dependent oxidoreductase n=1 Tax=unclassified Rhodococcus (in: high G+C Gram-positive bacteria) TaxID=192944 RepID=UPI0027807B7A|nr:MULTISPECIES: FAD-dependent oxidoreductase [unclassified Rhodococcus (in: high G+C Gram-positive bacteria)]MDQ1179331.1 3-phenylpropionate/trans-cinnamate dioxygenase ferredoxin reductase subunit [Rhodococcus sp. SORGH_AS_0301]MDQ1200623.1 3-phenylpropionate/trans-cinnamate dioxygenase ferredoxin reductase subunit [Rhodococcus sp. SORGH_AS_0303]
MSEYDYVIVGGGMVADNAAKGIREHDENGTILVVGSDVDGPYTRPALSKKLWTDAEFTTDEVPLGTEETGATLVLSTTVTSIDRDARTVTTDKGDTHHYGSLLLATGATPTTLDLRPSERVVYFRTFADYRRLRALATEGTRIVVVGGGYIGTEIAAALAQNKVTVTLVSSDDVVGGHMFPADLASVFQQDFEDHGVTVRTGVKVDSGAQQGNAVSLTLSDGSTIDADAVVFGLGVTPNTDLAEQSGLDVDNGIVVDEFLRTADEHVYAAGDVANYPDAILGRRRIEHVDNANSMGKTVGKIMAGSTEPYTYTPYFYSDVFDNGYQAVGTMSTDLRTVEDWKTPGKEGVVYYLDDDSVLRGVLMWNVWEGLDTAREMLKSGEKRDDESLLGAI